MDRRRRDGLMARFLDELERDLVMDALRYTSGNESATARILGMSRLTVRRVRARCDWNHTDGYRIKHEALPWYREITQ